MFAPTIEDLYADEKKAYFDYINEKNGTLLGKHEKPDPVKVEAKRTDWEYLHRVLRYFFSIQDIRSYLEEVASGKVIKRKKK